ncbi:thimet oligopeptidase [Parelusimicrobium proximum]|uniref:M3 family metallopeptidase n=1 Tax=Parelusimicrobium proximum TaxID=3228953 RepID=UPI003D16690E
MKKTALVLCGMFAAVNIFGGTMDKMFKGQALRFDYTPEEVLELEKEAAQNFEEEIEAVLSVPAGERSLDNTLLAFERAFTNYWYVPKTLALLTYFHNDAGVREAAAALESKGSQFKAGILARKDIYNALKAYAASSPELAEEEERLLNFWFSRFKRAGAELEYADSVKYAELTKEKMSNITKFNVNLMNHKDQLELTRDELDGLSDVYINRLNKTSEGKYIVTLKYPDYNPFMANAKNAEARKSLQIKFANRGGKENVRLLEETLLQRSATSRMLGYKNHPQYVLEDRMAKDEKTLSKFLSDIEKNLKSAGKEDLAKYKALKDEMEGKKTDGFYLWDVSYYTNEYMKKHHNVDHEKIKEYFTADTVIKGMFEVFGELFGLKFEKADLPIWHKDVLVYKIKDAKTGEHISNFYMDLYPRDGKYTHAACWSFIDGYLKADGKYQTPSVVIASNMNPPGNGIPSLLNHSEVTTLFHEFGHVLQMSLTHPKYASLGGDNITWDYIETHSQLLENWAWQKDVLKKISKHYKTGEQLPEDMMDSLIKSKSAGASLPMLRQNFMGELDYQYHKSNKPVNTTKVYETLINKMYMIPLTPGTHPQGNFAHIMSLTDPYDVGYYVYAWSLVIADDIFSVFEEKGIYDKDLGAKLRTLIYTPGISKDPNAMVSEFLGRPYNNKAFLKNFGVKSKQKKP